MRKVVLIMTASIDGYVVAPSGEVVGGHPEPAELKRWKLERIRRAGTHIMGRTTYEGMASFWPTSKDEYAAPMNEIPKVVFSKSLEAASWPESSIARGPLSDEIAALKKKPAERSSRGAEQRLRSRCRGPSSSTSTPSSRARWRMEAARPCFSISPPRLNSKCSQR
jgi:dihydrofolate reductase